MPAARTLKLGRHLTRRNRTVPTRGGAGGPSAFALQNATWYVDARAYSGSGDLLDLSPNGLNAVPGAAGAAPTWLPYTGSKYLYLPGSAGNTIACTAPANTASYAAYPLGGGAATTGAASSGAFTFQTGGSWLRLDLLNGSGTVLASFNASSVSSPYTGHTDSFSVAWTINRAASGLKSALVDRPMFLLGADDYFEVADNNLLDFGASQDFTAIFAFRSSSSSITQMVLAKDGLAGATSWDLQLVSNNLVNSRFGATASGTAPAEFGGGLHVASITRNGDSWLPGIDGVNAAGTTGAAASNLTNTAVLSIGRRSSGNYFEGEFLGAAIFRRALSAAEIAQLVREFQ